MQFEQRQRVCYLDTLLSCQYVRSGKVSWVVRRIDGRASSEAPQKTTQLRSRRLRLSRLQATCRGVRVPVALRLNRRSRCGPRCRPARRRRTLHRRGILFRGRILPLRRWEAFRKCVRKMRQGEGLVIDRSVMTLRAANRRAPSGSIRAAMLPERCKLSPLRLACSTALLR